MDRPFPQLILPFSLFLILSFLYLLVIPVGESPDEPGHMQCIEQVAQARQLPHVVEPIDESLPWRAPENIFSDYMCYHMPLYYLLSGQIVRIVAAVGDAPLRFDYPALNADYRTNGSMFVHGTRLSLWQRDEPLTMLSLRVVSILFGLLVLGGTYVVANRVFPEDQLVALTAVSLLAGWPQFIFLSRAISNDGLATALAISVLVVLTDVGKPQRFPLAAFLSALALLTKVSVAFTIGVVGGIWLIELLFLRSGKSPYWRAIAISVLIWCLAVLLVRFTPALWENWQLTVREFSSSRSAVLSPAYWQQVYAWTMSSGWAWFGWLSVRPPEIHARLWWLFVEVGVVLGLYVVLKRAMSIHRRVLLATLALWGATVILAYVRVTSNRWQPQFRLAFALLPLLTTLLAGGTVGWLSNYPHRQRGAWLLLNVLLAAYNVWLLVDVIAPAYGISSH